ncbi:mediator of RNA polymerase II transcription subunit 28-like [Mytilus galloprovincialis]|uniref:Mediator of RNA polymerase II transcription subunit 28 n=1 Tax=Mytilus galloprovincialis TaxID=29158 RepID=A0A8B6GH85_MYTGA|nr:mediator of RNA polymerase II transcription subunit 28 [Mytilus galloprovincialis]
MNPENLKPNFHLIDELEASFQNCTAAVTSQEHFNTQDTDELKPGAEQTFQKFLDLCRQTEAFFLNKRLVLSKQKPEQVIKDETEDLRAELERKDALIKRNQEKLQQWQTLLNNIQRGPGGNLPGSHGAQNHQPHQSQQMHPPHGYNVQGGTQMAPMGGSQMYHPHHNQGPPQTVGMMMPPQGPVPGHQPPPAYSSQVPSALASLETMSSLGMQERR